jgi:hypothetical protein
MERLPELTLGSPIRCHNNRLYLTLVKFSPVTLNCWRGQQFFLNVRGLQPQVHNMGDSG